MKIVFILVLCLTQALCDPFVLLTSKIAALKNPEDDFVGVVKGQHQSEPEAEHPADKVDATKEVVHTTTDQVPPPPLQPATTTTSTTETTQKTDATQTSSSTSPTTTDKTTTTTTTTTTAKKDESEVPLEGHGDTTVVQPEAEKAAAVEKPKETGAKEETTTTKTATDADVLEKLKNLKERVEKLENEETQKADYGKGSGGAPTTGTNNNIVPVSGNYVNTANGPAPKVYDGNGVPHPGQIIGVSPFGVAKPLIGIGAADPSNKQKYNSVDVGKALNTDTKAISAGKGVAEQADQAHKDFLDENTEEFERVMSWLQEQQHLLPKQHQPPKLLFQILKERIMIQEQKVLSQMLEKQQVQQLKQEQPQQQLQQPLLQQEKFQKLDAFPNLHIVAYDNNNPAPSQGNSNTIIS